MRPVGKPQSTIRYPLSRLFSTEAQLRIMRELALAGKANKVAGVGSIAKAAGLSRGGTSAALERMAATGLIEPVGAGRQRGYRVRATDPLAGAIVALFEAERDRHEHLLFLLREAVNAGDPPASWAFLVGEPLSPDDALHLTLVQEASTLDASIEALQARLLPIEARYDLTLEVSGLSRAEAPAALPAGARTLAGYPPGLSREPMAFGIVREDDPGGERRAMQIARFVADAIDDDPALVDRALAHLERAKRAGAGTAERALQEWSDVLDTYSPRRLRAFLVSSSERATRLRRSSPLVPALDETQRARLARHLAQIDGPGSRGGAS